MKAALDPVAVAFFQSSFRTGIVIQPWRALRGRPRGGKPRHVRDELSPLRGLFCYQFALGVRVGLGETTACKYCQNAAAGSNWARETRVIISISEENKQQLCVFFSKVNFSFHCNLASPIFCGAVVGTSEPRGSAFDSHMCKFCGFSPGSPLSSQNS